MLGGTKNFAVLSWMCKKQTAISHSSAEAEVISLDAGLRMEGIPALLLWDQVLEALSDKVKVSKIGQVYTHSPQKSSTSSPSPSSSSGFVPPVKVSLDSEEEAMQNEMFRSIDEVTSTYPVTKGGMSLVVLRTMKLSSR